MRVQRDHHFRGQNETAWLLRDDRNKIISNITVDNLTDEIKDAWTVEAHRGHGHAKALYEIAANECPCPHGPRAILHSYTLTREGMAFRDHVGGPRMCGPVEIVVL